MSEILELKHEVKELAKKFAEQNREIKLIHGLLQTFAADMMALDEEIGAAIDRTLPAISKKESTEQEGE